MAKLMRRHGIVGISPRGWVPPTTIVEPPAAGLPDLRRTVVVDQGLQSRSAGGSSRRIRNRADLGE